PCQEGQLPVPPRRVRAGLGRDEGSPAGRLSRRFPQASRPNTSRLAGGNDRQRHLDFDSAGRSTRRRLKATSTASQDGERADVVAPPVVARKALFETLSAAERAGGVTLVSAPAGSGKTILLRSWLDGSGLRDRAAWVSVDRGEQDAQRFWLSLIEQLRAAVGPEAFVDRLAPTA